MKQLFFYLRIRFPQAKRCWRNKPAQLDVNLLRYTEKDFQKIKMEEWLESKVPALRLLVLRWFHPINNCGDDVQSVFHDNRPMACVDNTPFAYINAFKSHVNIGFFYGAYLPDRTKILEGNGKHMHHIKLHPESSSDDAAIQTLIEAAYNDIQKRISLWYART
ncbi:MAG: DUF1801 domain-containing protein [Flammeovirgaceae bacterium]